MRRGATKVPKSNSMNEARMSEIPSQIDLKGASSFFTSRRDGRHVPRKHSWSSAKLPPCATPPRHPASVPWGAI